MLYFSPTFYSTGQFRTGQLQKDQGVNAIGGCRNAIAEPAQNGQRQEGRTRRRCFEIDNPPEGGVCAIGLRASRKEADGDGGGGAWRLQREYGIGLGVLPQHTQCPWRLQVAGGGDAVHITGYSTYRPP